MAGRLGSIDANLISLLQEDGRLLNTELARRLGIAEATVRKHLSYLLDNEIIQIGAWGDPLKLGYQVYAHVEIRARPPEIEKTAERVAALPEIFFVGLCTGAFDILAAGLFRSNRHLDEFFTKRLTRIPGIVSTVTYSIMRVVKRDYRYAVMADSLEPAARARRKRGPVTKQRTGTR